MSNFVAAIEIFAVAHLIFNNRQQRKREPDSLSILWLSHKLSFALTTIRVSIAGSFLAVSYIPDKIYCNSFADGNEGFKMLT